MAKERKVKKDEMVKVYGTGESFMKANVEYKVHSVAAEKLIAKGAATSDKPTGKTKYPDGYARKGTGIAGQRIRESEHSNPPAKTGDAKDAKK